MVAGPLQAVGSVLPNRCDALGEFLRRPRSISPGAAWHFSAALGATLRGWGREKGRYPVRNDFAAAKKRSVSFVLLSTFS